MVVLKKLVFGTLICFLIALFVGIGQFSQLLHNKVDIRSAELQRWSIGDSERLLQVEEFTRTCLIGKPVKQVSEISSVLISIEGCAGNNSLENVAKVVKQADTVLKSYAWPLSLIAN